MKYLPLLLLLLSACAPAAPIAVVEETLVYDCAGGYRFPVRIEGESAWVFLVDRTVELQRTRGGASEEYVGEDIHFTREGEQAQLVVGGKQARRCSNDRVAAIWEDAKFRGVDFRAAGNEPGWYLEMDPEQIFFVGQYGQQRITFPYTPPRVDDQRARSRFASSSGKDQLELTLEAGDCYDTMSGERFETRVTLKLNGLISYGCGRALH